MHLPSKLVQLSSLCNVHLIQKHDVFWGGDVKSESGNNLQLKQATQVLNTHSKNNSSPVSLVFLLRSLNWHCGFHGVALLHRFLFNGASCCWCAGSWNVAPLQKVNVKLFVRLLFFNAVWPRSKPISQLSRYEPVAIANVRQILTNSDIRLSRQNPREKIYFLAKRFRD